MSGMEQQRVIEGPPEWRRDPVRLYAEARADADRAIEGLETRIKETESRIIKRLDDQERYFERGADGVRAHSAETDKAVRELERELARLQTEAKAATTVRDALSSTVETLTRQVIELRTTNRVLGACTGFAIAGLTLALTAVALFK